MPVVRMIVHPAAAVIRFRIANAPLIIETSLRHFFGRTAEHLSRYFLWILRKISHSAI